MHQSNSPASQISEILVRYRKWWLVPTLLCTVAAIAYALVASKSYSSRQTLVIRDDLVGTFFKPGRFDSLDSMKSAQETLLEISRRPQVVRSALEKIGPPPLKSNEAWLSDENLEKMQGKIQISAPNGAEFGRTEAVVLSVEQSTRERAGRFVTFLLDEIEKSLRDLRSRQFKSMRHELNQAANVAESSYSEAAAKLRKFEQNVGVDLSTLISLNDSQAGTNNLQSELANLNVEKRKAWSDLEEVKKQIEILTDVANSPEALLDVPQELLQLQPTLDNLAKGLYASVLSYSKIKGRFQVSHPRVRESAREVEDIKVQIKSKLASTLGSLRYQLDLRQRKYEQITSLVDEKKVRLGQLSSMRVDYETLKTEVGKKREINGKAQSSLAEIESLGQSSKTVNLIVRVDQPQTDIYPIGPSNKIVVFGGMAAGLFIGFGMVMFVAPTNGQIISFHPEPSHPGPNRERSQVNLDRNETETQKDVGLPESQPVEEQSIHRESRSISEMISQRLKSALEEKHDDESLVNDLNSKLDAETKLQDYRNKNMESELDPPKTQIEIDKTESTFTKDSEANSDASTEQVQPPNKVSGYNETSSNELAIDAVGLQEVPEFQVSEESIIPSNTGTEIEEPGMTTKNWESDFESKSEQSIELESSSKDTDEIETEPSPIEENTDSTDESMYGLDSVFAEQHIEYEESKTSSIEQEYQIQQALDSLKDSNQDSPTELNETSSDTNSETDTDVVASIQVPTIVPQESAQDFAMNEPVISTEDDSALIERLKDLQQAFSEQSAPEVSQDETPDTTNQSELPSPNDLPTDIVAEEISLSDSDLESLRVGQSNADGPAATFDDLGNNEIIITDEFDQKIESIQNLGDAFGSPAAIEKIADSSSTVVPLDTSIQNSFDAKADGNESEPNKGNQPEDRPAATTVDLRMLKDQLAGKKESKPNKPLSDVLSNSNDDHVSDDLEENHQIDESLADLAKSIRDMCEKPKPRQPELSD